MHRAECKETLEHALDLVSGWNRRDERNAARMLRPGFRDQAGELTLVGNAYEMPLDEHDPFAAVLVDQARKVSGEVIVIRIRTGFLPFTGVTRNLRIFGF